MSLTVTDSKVTPAASAVSTTSFNWVVAARPTIGNGNPSTLRTTEGVAPAAIAVAYTCPNAPCTITLAGTAPGLGLSTVNSNTANNTTTAITVSNFRGTVYLNGTVQSNAVPNGSSSAAYSPTLTIRDAANATAGSSGGSWTIYNKPTITALTAMSTMETGTPVVSLSYTCPYTACKITLAGSPPGLGLNTFRQQQLQQHHHAADGELHQRHGLHQRQGAVQRGEQR